MPKLTKSKVLKAVIKIVGFVLMPFIIIGIAILSQLLAGLTAFHFQVEAKRIILMLSSLACFFIVNFWLMYVDDFAESRF